MFLIHFVYPFLVKILDKMNFKLKKIIGYFLVIFMTLNMLVSFTALGRQALRNKGYPPFTVIGEFYDKVYPDEVLKKAYQNMKFVR